MTIRYWLDGYQEDQRAVDEQLQMRPGEWGVIAEMYPPDAADTLAATLRGNLGGDFEVSVIPLVYGKTETLCDVHARYVGSSDV